MSKIRARFPLRVWFLVLSLLLIGATLVLFRSEGKKEWKEMQDRYHTQYKEEILKRIQQADTEEDDDARQKWSRLLEEAQDTAGFRMKQIFLPDAGVRDLCQTCHIAMENPIFEQADNPLRTHPREILRDHKLNRFGCTLCHQGQGVGLTMEKAHGHEHNWEYPLLPGRYVQALCLGCHDTSFGLEGAEKAERGRVLFHKHGCYGCHQARNTEKLPFIAPPFEGIATKVYDKAWLYQWIKEPKKIRPKTLMPAFRFKEGEVRHIVAYVSAQKTLPKKLSPYQSAGASYKRGRKMFRENGCMGCHGDIARTPSLTDRVPNLSSAGQKLYSRWIITWLEDTRALNPDTAMPRLMLTDEERLDLTAYVKSRRPKKIGQIIDSTWQCRG